jgi:hypothetical protein
MSEQQSGWKLISNILSENNTTVQKINHRTTAIIRIGSQSRDGMSNSYSVSKQFPRKMKTIGVYSRQTIIQHGRRRKSLRDYHDRLYSGRNVTLSYVSIRTTVNVPYGTVEERLSHAPFFGPVVRVHIRLLSCWKLRREAFGDAGATMTGITRSTFSSFRTQRYSNRRQ